MPSFPARVAASLFVLHLIPGPTSAAASPEVAVRLDPVIVTAVRGGESQSETLAAVTVIERADIERLQAQNLQDLLVGLPGVWIVNNGGPGKQTNVQLRGSNSDHVVVLVDGIKIGSATLGATAFEQIPVDQIERIEIVRGPRSSLYGSEAIGGVIQIFTRRGTPGAGLTPSFAIGGGHHGSGSIEAGAHGGAGPRGWYRAGLSAQTTDNIDVRPAGSENDRDGYRQAALSLGGGWTFANGTELTATALRTQGRNEYDSSFANESDNQQRVLGTRARFAPLRPWTVTLSAGESRDQSESYRDPKLIDPDTQERIDNRGSIETRRRSAGWQNDISLARAQILSGGIDFVRDDVGGSTDYAVRSRDNIGAFALYRGGFGAADVQASVRHDDNEQFGSQLTGGGALGYRLAEALRFSASYGSAFKAPSFNDLYFPGYGLPGLEPERSRSREIGFGGEARAAGGVLHYALNGYRTTIDNLIVYNPVIFGPENLGKAKIDGVEAQLGAHFETLQLLAVLNWLDPRNDNRDANRGNTLPRRAQRTARLDVDYAVLDALSLGLTLLGVDDRYDDVANTRPLSGYAQLGLRANWQIHSAWALQLKTGNTLDKDYETVRGYAQPGRSWFATLRYTPHTHTEQAP